MEEEASPPARERLRLDLGAAPRFAESMLLLRGELEEYGQLVNAECWMPNVSR